MFSSHCIRQKTSLTGSPFFLIYSLLFSNSCGCFILGKNSSALLSNPYIFFFCSHRDLFCFLNNFSFLRNRTSSFTDVISFLFKGTIVVFGSSFFCYMQQICFYQAPFISCVYSCWLFFCFLFLFIYLCI